LIERRQLSPVELTDALLARIETLDPQLNTFLLPTPEKAREQARAAEREIMAGSYRGPLHGISFGLKDIYATAGIRTTSHSKICENLVPTEDATTVAKLYQAGGGRGLRCQRLAPQAKRCRSPTRVRRRRAEWKS
jgi:aspartyl-tRNA(Asn)/glutamyl-tRNA(Gln) amidotransferase subunit A